MLLRSAYGINHIAIDLNGFEILFNFLYAGRAENYVWSPSKIKSKPNASNIHLLLTRS